MTLSRVRKTGAGYFWAEEEKALLTSIYRTGGSFSLSRAVEALAPKSRSTIAAQASRLKLTVPRPRKTLSTDDKD